MEEKMEKVIQEKQSLQEKQILKVDTDYLKARVRSIADWPKPGIVFRDITPLFQDAHALRNTMSIFVDRYFSQQIDLIAGIDARGFLLGVTLAYLLGISFVPIRKKGKLPYETICEEYELEYESAAIEIHKDACKAGDRVVLFDDLVATGGTMLAAARLLRRLGSTIVETTAIINLPELGGAKKLQDAGCDLFALLEF